MIVVPQYGHSVRIETKSEMVSNASVSPTIPIAVNWLTASEAWNYVHSSLLNSEGFWIGSNTAGLRTSMWNKLFPSYNSAYQELPIEFAHQEVSWAYSNESIIYTTHRPDVSNTMVHIPEVFDFPADYRQHYAVIPSTGVAVALGLGAHVQQGYTVLEMNGVPSAPALSQRESGRAEFGKISLQDLCHTAIQLAAGSQPALEQLTLNIVELKDVPQSIRGVVDFAKFVSRVVRGGVQVKTAITAIAAAYLTYKYGIAPTVDFATQFLDSLQGQLVRARGVLDSLHLRAFDAMLHDDEAKQRYLDWVAYRDAQHQAYLRRKELRKQAHERRIAREQTRRALYRRQRELLNQLKHSVWSDIAALRAAIENRSAEAHQALVGLGLRRDALYEMMDEHRSARDTTVSTLWALIQQARERKFTDWKRLKEHEHALVWLYSLKARNGLVPYESVSGLIQSDLYSYEQAYQESASRLVEAEASLRDFDSQAAEAYSSLLDSLSDLKAEQNAVSSAARDVARDLQQQLFERRREMDMLKYEANLLREREHRRLDARRRRIRSRRQYRDLLREALSRVQKAPTRRYFISAPRVSSRRRLSGRERGDVLDPQAAHWPLSVTYEATIQSSRGECLGACIQRTFQEHLGKIVRTDVRTLHDHLVYRQWEVAKVLSTSLDSVGHVVDYLYNFVQPVTTAWNLVPFSFVVDWGIGFSTVTKSLESLMMAAVLDAQPSVAWDVHKLTPVYGDNWSRYPEPLSVEVRWIDNPTAFRREHRVSITLNAVCNHITYGAATKCCALRYPFSMSSVGAIIPPVSLKRICDHVTEIGALIATLTK